MSKIIGLNYGAHDTSTALIVDGEIIFAMEEEKMTGIKACDSNWQFPDLSLDVISREYGVTLDNCDYIALSRPYYRNFIKNITSDQQRKSRTYSHHHCHTMGSYLTSGFEGKVISVSHDGKGYRSRGKILLCKNGEMEEIHSQHIPTTASLAGIWAASTNFLGWRMLKDEGKVVGLAAHGKFSQKIYDWLKMCISYDENLSFQPANWESIFHYIFDQYCLHSGFLNHPGNREDFAYTLQKYSEEIMEKFLVDLSQRHPDYRKICFSGGLFANVKLNQHINSLDIFDEMFIHPSMGDGGLALGAALICANEIGEYSRPKRLKNAFLGESHGKQKWETTLQENSDYVACQEMTYEKVAQLIEDGDVIGCFFGRTEYGPRALGNRSIVVKPTDPETHSKLNQKLKRTEIMPFAPSVLEEHADTIFECEKSKYSAEFMTLCYNTRPEWLDTIPAVVQLLDRSSRPQIVNSENNPNFHSIISAYFKISGIPVVLNTSFNAHGEPINNYPHQVIRHLIDGVVDHIVTEDFIISRKIS